MSAAIKTKPTEVTVEHEPEEPSGIAQREVSEIGEYDPAVVFSNERVDLMKKILTKNVKVTQDEIAVFLEQCKRSGLDPLLSEAYLVARRSKITLPNGNEDWITVHSFMASEHGMAGRCEAFSDYRGIKGAAVREGDSIEINQSTGEVKHTYDPTKRGQTIIGAWARVEREGHSLPVEWVNFQDYLRMAGKNPVWGSVAENMIAKVARFAARRRAYPRTFGSVYTEEELNNAEGAPPIAGELPANTDQPKPATKTEAIIKKVTAKLGPPSVRFGEHKGKPLVELTMDELAKIRDQGKGALEKDPKAKFAASLSANLSEIDGEISKRQKDLATDAKEPSEDEIPF